MYTHKVNGQFELPIIGQSVLIHWFVTLTLPRNHPNSGLPDPFPSLEKWSGCMVGVTQIRVFRLQDEAVQ